MKRSAIVASLLVLGLAGCATTALDNSDGAAPAGAAAAELRDAAGHALGTASVTQTDSGFRLRIVSSGMPAGVHGAHLHAVGSCQAPDFTSAGPHWNPTNRLHGRENPQGHHLGDVPNLLVGTDGQGTLEVNVPAAQLERGASRLLDEDGASLVIHASADDYRTDPSGNSGARIACGVLRPVVVR